MSDVDPTRRALILAGAMGVGLFPLFALDDGGPDDPDVSYDDSALRRVVGLGTPAIPRTFPVEIESDHVAANRDRALSLLSSAPESPGIPNEAVAREYADRYEEAVEALARAEEARTPYERLDALQSARWFAADVSAVSTAFAGDLTREEVLARREPIRERLTRLRDRWRYVGDDLAVAVDVHGTVESRVDYAEGTLERAAERRGPDENRVLAVGSAAGTVELARTAAENATYYYDRFVESLTDPRPLEDALDRTARVLVSDVTARCPEPLADEWESRFDRDLAYTAAHDLLRDAVSDATWRCRAAREARDREGIASAVLTAAGADRDLRALDRVRAAVDRGAYGVPRSTEAARREKLAALEAIETARAATPTVLTSGWTRGAVENVDRGDRTLSRAIEHDGVGVNEVARAVAAYAWARTRAAATPGALSRLTAVLDAAATSRTR